MNNTFDVKIVHAKGNFVQLGEVVFRSGGGVVSHLTILMRLACGEARRNSNAFPRKHSWVTMNG